MIEFKSPDDELSEATLWKVIGYAGFRSISKEPEPDDILKMLINSRRVTDAYLRKQYKTFFRMLSKLDRERVEELGNAKVRNELSLIEVKCSIGAREDLGRPTTTALENKQNFMEYLKNL